MVKKYLTSEGRILLENKIKEAEQRLKDVQVEKNIAYTTNGDGWHDNPTYISLGQLENRMTKDLDDLIKLLSSSVILDVKNRNTDEVWIGSIVKYKQTNIKSKKSNILTFEIVGHGESNLKKKKISYDSKIGLALKGRKVGEKSKLEIPVGEFDIEILQLYNNWDEAKKN